MFSNPLRRFESYVMQPAVSITEYDKTLTDKRLKNIVFKKSTKTPNHIGENVAIQKDTFKFGEKDNVDVEDVTPRRKIPKARSSLLKARSGSNATLWNKFVKQNTELARGKNATTIMYPTIKEEKEENEQISFASSKATSQ